jgi:FkbH-like protein
MKLLEAIEILKRPVVPEAPPFKIGLGCGFNPLHLETLLRAELQLAMPNRRIESDSGIYGDFWGNINRLGDLEKSGLDSAVVLIEWPDLDLRYGIRHVGAWNPATLTEIVRHSKTFGLRLQRALEQLSVPVVICLPTLPMPPLWITPGWQASASELEVRATLILAIAQIARQQNIRVVNGSRLDRISVPATRLDADWEFLAGFPYKHAHASALAELLSSLIRKPTPKKGLITDLDGTLWRGILGEDGVDGVSWDLDHKSQVHGLYQQMLQALSSTGVLIGVASKNDPTLVEKAFDRADMVLPKTAIFPIEASWRAKSESVRRILKAWNISADDVVFVDDSPLELAEVKGAHPEIHSIHFPSKTEAVVSMLDQLRDVFGKNSITEEDQFRLESIRRSQQLTSEMGGEFQDAADFLRQAEAELTITSSKELVDARAFELVNKTNQFNLNGKRYTEAAWQSYLRRDDSFLLVAAYRDKYGPLGKISVIGGRRGNDRLVIDFWVMSCRAFARQIEHKCLEELFSRSGVREIEFDYTATERNGPLTEFLRSMLGEDPAPASLLSRERFVQRVPQTFHRVLEAVNG